MKLFLDTVNIEFIKKWSFFIDGITTNPSLLSKEKSNHHKHIVEICAIMKGKDVSVEVTEQEPHALYKQAHTIAKLAQNVVVKIPCHKEYYDVIQKLIEENVRINVTLVFSLMQALFMCKLRVTYISFFVGRLNDINGNGAELLRQVRESMNKYQYPSQLLAASLRSVAEAQEAAILGADALTLPIEIFEKTLTHPLTDQGIEQFITDWSKVNPTNSL